MFSWGEGIVDKDGYPLKKVYIIGESTRPYGLKHNGVRPIGLYIMEIEHSDEVVTESMKEWVYRGSIYAMDPMVAEISFQNNKLRKAFGADYE